MTRDNPHPGFIKMINVSANTSELVPYDSVPAAQRQVMLTAQGVQTSDPALAKEVIPIVEVKVIMFDAKGDLSPPQTAVSMRIFEYGPNERLLRSTSMAGPAK